MCAKNRDTDKIKRLVAFSALMQRGGGIWTKSPDYILEKFSLCMGATEDYQLTNAMSGDTIKIWDGWVERWGHFLNGRK